MPFGDVNYSSATNEWATPQAFYDRLHAEFGFTLDAAAQDGNAKCERYFTPAQDGLAQPWEGRVFVNPPYGRGVGDWVAKAALRAALGVAEVVVVLIFARTDTVWWETSAMRAQEIRFVRGRLKFGGAKNAAPSPSALIVFRSGTSETAETSAGRGPVVSTYNAAPAKVNAKVSKRKS